MLYIEIALQIFHFKGWQEFYDYRVASVHLVEAILVFIVLCLNCSSHMQGIWEVNGCYIPFGAILYERI